MNLKDGCGGKIRDPISTLQGCTVHTSVSSLPSDYYSSLPHFSKTKIPRKRLHPRS